jgi:hypothetical protein
MNQKITTKETDIQQLIKSIEKIDTIPPEVETNICSDYKAALTLVYGEESVKDNY